MPNFKFIGTGFALGGGDYVPGSHFTFSATPLLLSVAQPIVKRKTGPPEFSFKAANYTPSGTFVFSKPELFLFPAQGYTPSTVFRLPWRPAESAPGQTVTTGVLAGTLAGVTGLFIGKNIGQVGRFSGSLAGVTGAFVGVYDASVHRYATSTLESVQQDASLITASHLASRRQGVLSGLSTEVVQDAASAVHRDFAVPVDASLPVSIEYVAVTDHATSLTAETAVPVEALTPAHIRLCGTVDQATRFDSDALSVLYQLELIRPEFCHPIDDAGRTQHIIVRRFYAEDAPGDNYRPQLVFKPHQPAAFDDGRLVVPMQPVPAFRFLGADYSPSSVFRPAPWSPSEPVIRPNVMLQTPHFSWPGVVSLHSVTDSQQVGGVRHQTDFPFQPATRTHLRWCIPVQNASPPRYGGTFVGDPPRPPPVVPIGHNGTFTIPTRQVYTMRHVITVTLLDLTPVALASVKLSYDADSFAWQFSGQLNDKADLPLVQQTPNGPPVQLLITINGYSWRVLVERIEHSREFAQRTINLTGRGLTALLGQPYQQPASATQSAGLTVQQLADLQMPVGWTVNWTASTWLVPSGAYTYSNQTPIQALASLVADIGAMLVPARDSQTIHIMPRYPVLPWYFDEVEPDLVIPESAIATLSQRPVIPYQANGVYVHGGEIGGKLAWCRLNGTDGARLAPTVSNALMTDVIGCRALGERILAGQYTQPAIQSLTLPMDGDEFPLAEAGQLAEIILDGAPVRGIINAVSIEASLASVRQTLQIGEETPNTWALFKELLPRDPLLVSTLSVADGATSLMTLLDGGVVRVRGSGTVGGKYYIRAGRIEGEAPMMGQNEVVV